MRHLIRPMRDEDMAGCRIVTAECWSKLVAQRAEPEFREAFSQSAWRPQFHVADVDGKVVGMAGYNTSWISYGVYNLFWVGVRPAWRNRGIATGLVERCLEDLDPIADAIMLVTGIPAFYERWGFETLKRIQQSESFGDILMIRETKR